MSLVLLTSSLRGVTVCLMPSSYLARSSDSVGSLTSGFLTLVIMIATFSLAVSSLAAPLIISRVICSAMPVMSL